MKTKAQHTPTPWKLSGLCNPQREIKDAENYDVALCDLNANAEFIVRAVNSHEALLEAAKDALCELDPDCNYDGSNYKGEPSDKANSKVQTILELYKAISQAEGK